MRAALLTAYCRWQEDIMTTSQLHSACEAWDRIAAGYDRFVAPTEVWLANEALKRAGLQRGERVLDVAAGPGGLSLPAARLGAHVMAVDWSPAMIECLSARAQDEGLVNVAASVMDCHALELDDDAFDLTASQFGVMLVPDQHLALAEMARVTKRGGRVLLIAYGAPAEIEFLHFFVGALQAVDAGFAGLPATPPLEFQVSDPNMLRARLTAAGLSDVNIDTVTERLAFRSGDEFWNWVIFSNPIAGRLTGHLTADQQVDMRRVLDGMLRERAGGYGPAILTNPVHIGLGRK
jgi:ubiquinone/menaquinone biosynthesis C-methylase UbiE